MQALNQKIREISQNILNNSQNFLWKNLVFYGFIILLSGYFINSLVIKREFHDYIFAEWFIHYRSGFVRRGLGGHILLFLQDNYSINAGLVLTGLSYFIFLMFSIFYVLKVKQYKKYIDLESLLVLLFLPVLILFPANTRVIVGRKEFLFFLSLLANLWLVHQALTPIIRDNLDISNQRKFIDSYSLKLGLIYNLISVPTTLTHEAILFLSLPLNLIITSSVLSLQFFPLKSLKRTIMIYAPTLVVSVICLFFKGNKNIALAICESWQKYSHLYPELMADCNQEMYGVLKFFQISTLEAIQEVIEMNILQDHGMSFVLWIFGFTINLILLMRMSFRVLDSFINRYSRQNNPIDPSIHTQSNSIEVFTRFSFKYILLPFIGTGILYVIALDWGRWLFITAISYVLCLLTPSLVQLETLHSHSTHWMLTCLSPLYLVYKKAVYWIYSQAFVEKFYPAYLSLFLYTLFFFKFPHFDIKIYNIYPPYLWGIIKKMIKFSINY
ncbi:hypothetical protein K4A83_01530 [Spirulina subsalsa FACHB-351]|uniref:Uncharacterized protein n=1 Tax=Spirulina subsalsa FACHB-351 TaxID=234711 RepID=A0ABT3L0C2_9CYAN|nr:hypothetical protein [Spirulina subsalsa]MCW6034955.1 hypothetical protein [Spirulina subsalsa FACHB-351]